MDYYSKEEYPREEKTMNRFGNNSEEEWSNVEHALAYLNKADNIPHRTEGEAVLLDYVPKGAGRILDLGAGDGRLSRACTKPATI